nr:MAG TPA: hypothetical protein [Bacteriophage sp.]
MPATLCEFPHRVSTLYMKQCIMASPCKSCIQKNKYSCFKKTYI